MAGDSEVGGNGSMHWRVRHGGNPAQGQGQDPDGGGNIRVEARFDSETDASTAWRNALQGKKIVFDVKAHDKPNYAPGQDAQVVVSWGDKPKGGPGSLA